MYILKYYLIAMAIGALTGLSELLSRYPWTILNIVKSRAGWAYIALNAIIAGLAYKASVEWQFPSVLQGKSEFWRSLLAAVFGMAILRSSFLNIRIGNENLPTGFAILINIFMRRAERALEQDVVNERWNKIEPIVEGLTYAATRDYLVSVTEVVLRSLSTDEIEALHKGVEKIDSTDVGDNTKLCLLAMLIIDTTNLDLFLSLAKQAKQKLVAENQLASRREAEKLKLLDDVKNLLRK